MTKKGGGKMAMGDKVESTKPRMMGKKDLGEGRGKDGKAPASTKGFRGVGGKGKDY